MRYVANPVKVDAFEILEIIELETREIALRLSEPYGGFWQFRPTPGMLARINPSVGDYVVVQSDGYVYLNPKDVFERKYSKEAS